MDDEVELKPGWLLQTINDAQRAFERLPEGLKAFAPHRRAPAVFRHAGNQRLTIEDCTFETTAAGEPDGSKP